MSMDVLLSRLRKAKYTARDSWLACCPAHEDKNPSLSIRDLGDGRILLNCFAGCSAENILDAIGLDWDDVMPPKAAPVLPIKPTQTRVYSTDALRVIDFEAKLIMVAAFDMSKGKKLDESSQQRLELAYQRIQSAMELANV